MLQALLQPIYAGAQPECRPGDRTVNIVFPKLSYASGPST